MYRSNHYEFIVIFIKRLSFFTLYITMLIFLWTAMIYFFSIPSWLMASPANVAFSLSRNWRYYFQNGLFTASAATLGLVSAVIIGVFMGIVLNVSKFFRIYVTPLIVALKSFPIVAIAPIITLLFGYGMASKVVVAFLLSWLPCIFGTLKGLGSVPTSIEVYATSVGFRWWQKYAFLRFPYALPYIATGIKTAAPLAVVGAVIGEFAGSRGIGLGHVILTASGEIATDQVYAALIVLAGIGGVLYGAAAALEKWIAAQLRLPINSD